MPVEGGALFSPALERIWTLYPGAYAWGYTYTQEITEEIKRPHEGMELGALTIPGAAVKYLFLEGGDPS